MLWLHRRKLRSADGEARTRAAHALAEGGSARAVEPLGEALSDRGWDDRSAAAVALGKLANGRGVAFLTPALAEDPDVDVRCSCAWALGRIGGNAALEPLDAALADDDDSVRRVAVEALAKVGTAAVLESLVRALGDRHHDVRLAAVKGLGSVGSGSIAPQLLAALEDSEWSVRCAAAESLATLDDSTAVPALITALAAQSLAVKLASAEALGRIGDPRAADHLVEALGGLEGLNGVAGCDLRLRRNVAKALGDIGKAAAVPALLVLATDRYTAGVAIEALGKVLRWDAAAVDQPRLRALSELSDARQAPWMIDEAEEVASGRVTVREGKDWPVDAAALRQQALAQLRRCEKDR